MNEERTITYTDAVSAIGHISAELAGRAGAWDGNAPDWFPEPPEWLNLFDDGLAQAQTIEERAT